MSHDTYSPYIQSWAAKLTLKSALSNITLANVLSGDTCTPISLSEFELYLAFVEQSLDNLQFLVWYQDYRKRFLQLPQAEQARCLDPETFSFSALSRASADTRAADIESNGQVSPISTTWTRPRPLHITAGLSTTVPALASPASPRWDASGRSSGESPSPRSVTGLPGLPYYDVEKQPMRKECMRMIATFLRPGAPKEISLDSGLRDTIIKNLTHNTHPDVILPAYQEMYNTLETRSLPQFLVQASTHINRPKQYFWFAGGIVTLLIAIFIALSLIALVPTPPQARRAYRLFAVPFMYGSTLQLYSAWRGFCSMIMKRGKAQMRVWEMQEVDEEAKSFWDKVLNAQDEETPSSPGQLWNAPDGQAIGAPISLYGIEDKGPADSALDLFADDEIRMRAGVHPTDFPPPLKYPQSKARNGFLRPPIFGPERVVQDPHIKAVHDHLLMEMHRLGVYVSLVFAAIILAVPSAVH